MTLAMSGIRPVFAAPLSLGSDLPYTVLEDESGQRGIDDVWSRLAAADSERHTEIFSRGYTRDAFWLRFEIPASAFENGDLWLAVKPNFLDDVRLYYRPRGNPQTVGEASAGPWHERRTGDTYAGSRGDLDYRAPVFVIPAPPNGASDYEMIVRVASSSALLLRLGFWQPSEFVSHAATSSAFYAFYFGLATISSLLALVLSILLKSRLLWSVTAMAAPYLSVACVEGYVAWLIPGVGLTLQHYLVSVLALLMYTFMLWMPAEAIGLRTRMLWVYKLFLASCCLAAPLLLSIPFGFYGLAIRLQTTVYFVTGAIFIVACFTIWWRDRFRPTTLMLSLGPFIFLLVSLAGMLSLAGWLPFTLQIYLLWQYVLIINMLLVMGIAVAQIRRQHLEALEKAELKRDLQREREAAFHQRQFMGMVAHEFRTPLAVISASLENLRQLVVDDVNLIRRHERIGRATERLVQLTDNCLADARLAADDLLVVPEPVSLIDLVSSAASLVQFSDDHRWQLTLEGAPVPDVADIDSIDVDPIDVDRIALDPALVRIALSNVIDNAVKYTQGGLIHIDLSRIETGWMVSIEDQGGGISESRVAVIFERYRRAQAEQGAVQGFGLGLYVSRQIARAHGGELALVTNTSNGCRFVFTLPVHSLEA